MCRDESENPGLMTRFRAGRLWRPLSGDDLLQLSGLTTGWRQRARLSPDDACIGRTHSAGSRVWRPCQQVAQLACSSSAPFLLELGLGL